MANDHDQTDACNGVASAKPALPAGNIGQFVLSPLNHAIAAGEREALKNGVPAHDVLEMLINHLASVTAMIEPAGARAGAVRDVVAQFPEIVRRYVEQRHTTPGGLFLRNPVDAAVEKSA